MRARLPARIQLQQVAGAGKLGAPAAAQLGAAVQQGLEAFFGLAGRRTRGGKGK